MRVSYVPYDAPYGYGIQLSTDPDFQTIEDFKRAWVEDVPREKKMMIYRGGSAITLFLLAGAALVIGSALHYSKPYRV